MPKKKASIVYFKDSVYADDPAAFALDKSEVECPDGKPVKYYNPYTGEISCRKRPHYHGRDYDNPKRKKSSRYEGGGYSRRNGR